MEWLMLSLAVLSLISVALAIICESLRDVAPHPDVEHIQWPLKPADPADIERRKTE